MRVMPGRYAAPKPVATKKPTTGLKHVSAPLKGLSLSSKLSGADPLTATILDNWVIEEDKISCRAGVRRVVTYPSAKPVWCLIPYYGGVNKLLAATNLELRLLDGSLVKGGFTSDDWHWTSFSNLSAHEYTVMVNGRDGVWSWDGNNVSITPAAVSLSKITDANPAVCTLTTPADISKFSNGMVVMIEGGAGVGMTNANGPKVIVNVGTPAGTFTLVGVDTTAAAADQTTGTMKATPPGTGVVKETVTAPTYAPHIVPDQFDIVLSHMNRLWFADKSNLSVYYLPIQQKSGTVTELPLNAVFRRGGHIRAMYMWTRDGGAGLDDMLCIFSSNGELVIYGGVDPDSDFTLAGIFRFDSPMNKHCVVNYGGDLYCLISTGLVPMSTLLKAETDVLGKSDRNVFSAFFEQAFRYRDRPGWGVMLNPSSGRMICNLPLGSPNSYKQMVRFMPNPVWASWSKIPSRCWAWMDNRVFIGSDTGEVHEVSPNFLNDNGNSIRVDVQPAWSAYGSSAIKQFKMVLPYIITDGIPKPYVDFKVDYDTSLPKNQPDTASTANPGAEWNVATWAITQENPADGAYWAGGVKSWNNWQGVAAMGRVGAPRLMVDIVNCKFSIAGFDVLYEGGVAIG